VLSVLGFVKMFDLDLCNDCDKLWGDARNYIKFIIKIDSLVKHGVAYSIFFLCFLYLILAPIYFSMIKFMSLTFLTDQMVNTRSGSGVDQPVVSRQGASNSNNPDP
jgi:hypothetical protein